MLSLSRGVLNEIIEGQKTLAHQIMAGQASVDGNARAVGELVSMLDSFELWFNIVRP
jgi:alkyl sulfatase BDS1-like metallo-beta-lactamase superfamily hydrolase